MDSRKGLPLFIRRSEMMINSSKKKQKMEQKQECNCSKWSELPNHISEMTVDRLGFPDILRFGSVCMPWKSVSTESSRRRSLYSQFYNPMVLFEYNLTKGTFGFFSFEEGKVYWITIEGSPAVKCVGTSQGWLVLLSPSLRFYFILNPFTGTRIDLPYLNKPEIDDFSKVILLSNPLNINTKMTNYDCAVVALNFSKELNICRLGDESWTVMKLDGHGQFIGSLIFHKGQIHALSTNGELWIINLAGPKLRASKFKVTVPVNISIGNEYHKECYLVELEETLLLVVRIKVKALRKTVRFVIYRLVENHHMGYNSNYADCMWVRELSLADDQALFLGRLCSKSVSITECRGLKGNSIYFTDDKLQKTKVPEYPETGIYNVKTVETLVLVFHLICIRSTCRTFGSLHQFEIGTLLIWQKLGSRVEL